MSKALVSILTAALLFSSPLPGLAEDLPGNEEKVFPPPHQVETDLYQEPEHVTYSVKKRILFQDIVPAIQQFYKETGRDAGPIAFTSDGIAPDRQMYFLGCAYTEGAKHVMKYVVLDAETGQRITGGEETAVPKFETVPLP